MRPSVVGSLCRIAGLAALLVGCGSSSDRKPDAGGADSLAPSGLDAELADAATDGTVAQDSDQLASDAMAPDANQERDANRNGPDANADGDDWGSDDAMASDAEAEQGIKQGHSPATVIVLPDTQYYTSRFTSLDIFATQTRWIVKQAAARHISAVLHVGDVIDYGDVKTDVGQDGQWKLASAALRLLDNVVPYVLSSGNHDETTERQGLMGKYFNLSSMPWLEGASAPDRVANSYAVATVGPQKWLLLSMEFSPRDATLTWADGVLKAHADLPAMIVTHAYLYADNTRYDYAKYGANQSFYPQMYGFSPDEGMNDGEQIWQKLVVPNPNVRLVFSGHMTAAGAHLTSTRPDGSKVHQMLMDFQWLNTNTPDDRGGDGYLEILEFDYAKKHIRVQTYSPYQDAFMRGEASEYTLSLEL